MLKGPSLGTLRVGRRMIGDVSTGAAEEADDSSRCNIA